MRSRALRIVLAVPAVLAVLSGIAVAQTTAPTAQTVDQLRYPPLREVQIPQPERVVLDNGMVVLLLEDHELPLVEATALVRVGSRLDPPGKTGLADLGATVLRAGGTQRLPSDQLDLWLESRAAAIEARAARDQGVVTMSALAQDFPEVLRVFTDVLRRPAFDAARLEVVRNQSVAGVARQNDDLDEILFREITELVYGPDSPYASQETLASLRAIGREDLVQWHRQSFHPDRIVLGLVGDFRKEEALRLVREAFGDWPRGPKAAAADAPFRTRPNPGVFWVEKNDVAQSALLLGHLGIRKDHPDFHAVEVLNYVLSGSFAARLINEVRNRKGLAYSVQGAVDSSWDYPGLAYFYATTKTATTGAGIQALLDEARGLKSRPPTEEEVEKARQGLLARFVFNVDSKREILEQQLDFEFFGYPPDWLTRYRAGLEAVTVDQVREAAIRHLRPEDFSILVVGPAEGRDRPLTDFGQVTRVDVTIK